MIPLMPVRAAVISDPVLALALGACILIFLAAYLTSRRSRPVLLPTSGLDSALEQLDAAFESGVPFVSVAGGAGVYGSAESCATLAIRNCLNEQARRLLLPIPLISSSAAVVLPSMASEYHSQLTPSILAPVAILFAGSEPFLLAAAHNLQTAQDENGTLALYGSLSPECALLVTAPEHRQTLVFGTCLPLSGLFAGRSTNALVISEHFYFCPAYLGSDSYARSLTAHDGIRWAVLLAALIGAALTLLGYWKGSL